MVIVDRTGRAIGAGEILAGRVSVGEPVGEALGTSVASALAEVLAGKVEHHLVFDEPKRYIVAGLELADGRGASIRLLEPVVDAWEARCSDLVRRLPDYVVLVDRDLKYLGFNRVAPGLSREGLEGTGVQDFVAEKDWPHIKEVVERVFETGDVGEYVTDGYGDGALTHSYFTRVVPASPEAGEPRAFLLTSDITAQRQAEVKLRRSENRFRTLVEASPDFIVLVDSDGRILYFNRVDGWRTEKDVQEKTVYDFSADETHPEIRRQMRRVFEDGVEGRWETRDRVYRDRVYVVRAIPILGEGEPRAMAIVTDVTEEREREAANRELERRLELSGRLESLGLLAGGVAHDFNNILTVVLAGASHAKTCQQSGKADLESIEAIIMAANRAASLVKKLLAFGRRSPLRVEVVDGVETCEAVIGLAERLMPEHVEIRLEPPVQSALVRADAHQLEQVLLNLCLNARDAMPDGGIVTIQVEAQEDRVCFRVTDTGTGIPDDVLPRIFEPFFTTKEVGKGTGLGLAMCDGIVRQLGGEVRVQTQSGAGTAITVALPRHFEAAAARTPTLPPPTGRGETILVAEDESLVLTVVKRILEGAGYRVIAACDGVEALAEFKAYRKEIDLVLMDAKMPRMDGWECFERIRALAADARVLFATGYATLTAFSESNGGDHRRPPLVVKPYDPDGLLRAVRAMLD